MTDLEGFVRSCRLSRRVLVLATLSLIVACGGVPDSDTRPNAGVQPEVTAEPPQPRVELGVRAASAGLPSYEVMYVIDTAAAGLRGDILITDMSGETPASELESVLRSIIEREGLDLAALYCSRDAYQASIDYAYADSNPDALRTCYLGRMQDDTFTPGDALL
jgi:hypothetical protein